MQITSRIYELFYEVGSDCPTLLPRYTAGSKSWTRFDFHEESFKISPSGEARMNECNAHVQQNGRLTAPGGVVLLKGGHGFFCGG